MKPEDGEAHTNLARVLHSQGKIDEAIAECREAIRIKPNLSEAHLNLGTALNNQGKVDEAVAEYREAIRLKPDLAVAHNNLGNALNQHGKGDEAIAEYRQAVRLEPDLARAHARLGAAMGARGRRAEAIDEYREAIRLEPDYAEAHCDLGVLLKTKGDYVESLAEYRRGHELGSKRPDWRYPSAEWVREAERLVATAARLPAVLQGKDTPQDAAEGLFFAEICRRQGLHASASRLSIAALLADPKLADDRRAPHRYNAACSAALAGCGKGNDDPPPDDEAKAKLRKQALDWLQNELSAWSKVLDAGDPKDRPADPLALAEGLRPGRYPRRGRAKEIARRRTEGLAQLLGRGRSPPRVGGQGMTPR